MSHPTPSPSPTPNPDPDPKPNPDPNPTSTPNQVLQRLDLVLGVFQKLLASRATDSHACKLLGAPEPELDPQTLTLTLTLT